MMRLHCFSQSGNAFKVAFLLRALGVPYVLMLESNARLFKNLI